MKNVRDIVFIIDRSGSMAHLTEETVRGYNDTVAELKSEERETRISLYLFNDSRDSVLKRVSADSVPEMTAQTYRACGCTALVDAVFDTVNEFDLLAAYGGKTWPRDVLFMITTDGLENASVHHRLEDLRRLINCVKMKFGWQFVFLGADLNAIKQATDMGIERKYAVRYRNDSGGTRAKYEAMKKAALSYSEDCCVCDDWADDVKEYDS